MGLTRALYAPADVAAARYVVAPVTALTGIAVLALGIMQVNPFSGLAGAILLGASYIPWSDSLAQGWLRAKAMQVMYMLIVFVAILIYGGGQVQPV